MRYVEGDLGDMWLGTLQQGSNHKRIGLEI